MVSPLPAERKVVSMTVYTVLWYFFLYAFLGWCAEVSYAALRTGRFVNRGFLNGPVCPIYGVGVVIVVGLLTPVKENTLLLFVCSVLLTSALEWVTGFVLERMFHQKWWDYSDLPLNLNGYICPLFSVLWGIACLLVMEINSPCAGRGAAGGILSYSGGRSGGHRGGHGGTQPPPAAAGGAGRKN